MFILTGYIRKTLSSMIILVILLVAGVEIFIEFTREFPDMGTGFYGLPQVLAYVPMTLPLNIYKLFPMIGLLGCILGLGLLASHHELIIMRVSGVSVVNIAKAVLKTALLFVIIMVLIGEVLAPLLNNKATTNKTEALSNGQTIMTRLGVWTREENNFIHINKVLATGQLEGITRYTFDSDNKLKTASYAKTAENKDGKWYFNDVVQTNFIDNTSTNSEHFATQQWDVKLKPRLLGMTTLDTDQKSLFELHSYINYQKQSGLGTANYEFIFWQRIFQPLASLVMILLAVPFAFGPLRSATMGLRMLAGIIVGFGFFIINQFVGPFSVVYQVPPILAAILPTLFFALCGGLLLVKVKK